MYKYITKDQLIIGKTYNFSVYATGFQKYIQLYQCSKCKQTYNVIVLDDKSVKINRFIFLNINKEYEKDRDVFDKYDILDVRCTICSQVITLSYYKDKEIAIRSEIIFV